MRFARLFGPVVVAALGVSLFPGRAGAATATTNFSVTANIDATCTIEATDLHFGSYVGDQVDEQSQIVVTCTNTSLWEVGLNEGSAGARVKKRRMDGPGGSSLSYNLYTDPARTNVWQEKDTGSADTVSGVGTGGPQVLTVYGRLFAGQNADTGGYSDTIRATITF